MGKVRIYRLAVGNQLNGLSVAGQDTSRMLLKSKTSMSVSLDEGNCLSRKRKNQNGNVLYVPVVSNLGKALMPCHPARANELIRKGKALRRFSRGIFYIKLTERKDGQVQSIAVGIDPGSKKEGFTVKSSSHTFLNIQADAITWVKDAVETRRNMRRTRRTRKTPCRQNKVNRKKGCLPPSTKARWGWKLRISNWLVKLYPISTFVVEDIKAKSIGKRRWDVSFSPLEVGKKWFYSELKKLGKVELRQGWETKDLRDKFGLKKTSQKLSNKFEAHCIDSWILANSSVGGHNYPDNKDMILIVPLRFHHRQLHVLQPAKGGIRKTYGGTRSLGLKRGSLVKHKKYGIVYVGGTSDSRLSVHSVQTGERLAQNIKVEDCNFLTYNSWRIGNSSAAFRRQSPCRRNDDQRNCKTSCTFNFYSQQKSNHTRSRKARKTHRCILSIIERSER